MAKGLLTLAGSCFSAGPAPGFGPAPSLLSIAVQLVTKADSDAITIHAVPAVAMAAAGQGKRDEQTAKRAHRVRLR